MPETPRSNSISSKLQRIASLSERAPEQAWTTLAHNIDMDWLREAWRRTRKDAAAGIDGVTAREYEGNLEGNLEVLLDRFHKRTYRAPPVRRVYIPKGDGKGRRPLGIPTLEDKILQRAVVMLLEAIYEQDFRDCSYGFRPGRSAKQAVAAVREASMRWGTVWVLDADIKSYFDTIDHAHLRSFLDKRVRDGVIRRTIGKWMHVGVLEDGEVRRSIAGTPQGGVISPLLANIYLHEVLDVWFEDVVSPHLEGEARLVRYADDFVIVFTSERDAKRVLDVLPRRLSKYGLTLHPDKTRLVRFERPRWPPGGRRPDWADKPGTFDFAGFTLRWEKSRRGRWVVKTKTATARFSRAVKAVDRWCRTHRHLPVADQYRRLVAMFRGHCNYYGNLGNGDRIAAFRFHLIRRWRKWLDRRSQRGRMPWKRMKELLRRFPFPMPNLARKLA